MHTKRIIPCLDVKNGRVVKGVNFVNLIDAGDPVAVGAAYDKAGADELVFLDITASSDQRNIVVDMVRRVAETIFIPFTVGGGIITGRCGQQNRRISDTDALCVEERTKIILICSSGTAQSVQVTRSIVRIICLPIHTTRIYDQRFIKKIKEEVYYV